MTALDDRVGGPSPNHAHAPDPIRDAALLRELEPVVARVLDRHLRSAREWFPHEYVPWSAGRDFNGPLGGEPWEPNQSRLSRPARTALVVNLLSEDNLPSYHFEISTLFGRDGAWGTWVHRWTSEEGKHGAVIRDYLLTTRAVDPVALERARMSQVSTGFASDYSGDLLGSLAYVAFQELATRLAHRNTGRFTGDPVCEGLLAQIALDESLHMVFYRDVLAAAFEIAPDATAEAVARVVGEFRMPGHGLPEFGRKAAVMAVSGIYDLPQHRDEVLVPILRHWRVFERTDLGASGERAREALAAQLDLLDRRARRFEERRDAIRAALRVSDGTADDPAHP